MFTINQITAAHSKVKSGADFPNYIQDLTQLGVLSYDTYVSDGHTVFHGTDNYRLQAEAKYPVMRVAHQSDKEKFSQSLKIHQQGQTGYLDFCQHAAAAGVEKWTVDTGKMTCTYYDRAGNSLLTEKIPAIANVEKT